VIDQQYWYILKRKYTYGFYTNEWFEIFCFFIHLFDLPWNVALLLVFEQSTLCK